MSIHKHKRIPALLLGVILLFAGIPAGSISAHAADTTQQLNNIVLFAQFSDADTDNFMADKTDTAIAICNDTSTPRSLTSYIDAISYGKLHVTSYFPQLADGVIQPYILQNSKAEYTNYEQYAIEMVQNIQIPDSIPLDGNQDGMTDNITLVIDGRAESMGDPLWAKAFQVGGLYLGDTPVGSINLMSSYTLLSSTIFSGVGTLCHEFLHSIGYPDLYRKDSSSGNPVGQWDLMATNSIFLQYPLAYQRYAVSGWLDAKTITTAGTYTLQPASSSTGDRLYLLKTPFSDTEFFAVEYRIPGKQYSEELDCKIYGEGMVVYRVNTAVQGNYRSDTDGIYVFRPDETTLNAGGGDLTRSCYGGKNAPDSIGSTDLESTFADGALVYSDGTNSGIALHDIQLNGDGTLSFSADFADVSDRLLWQTVDSVNFPADQTGYDMVTGDDGKLYLLSANTDGATLYCVENDTLQPVSTVLSGTMYNPKLAFSNGTPYLLWQDSQYFLHLNRWNSTSGVWQDCCTGTELAQYADIAADSSGVYVTYTTGSFPYVLHAFRFDNAAGTVSLLGDVIADNACNMEIAAANGSIGIGYRDLNDNNVPKLAVWDGTAWNTTTLSEQDCGTVSVLADGNSIWVVPSGGKTDVFRWESGTVTNIPLPEAVQGRAFQMTPAVAQGNFYMTVNAQNPEEFVLYGLNKDGTWSLTGNPIAQSMVNQPVLAAQKQALYCLYATSDLQMQLKKLTLETETPAVTGDVNGDGTANLADAVLLQKYLLGETALTAAQAKAADLQADDSINGFDLAVLRQLLTKVA
ncbi:dockerin type I domain-containing protein [Ruminococcus callidus]|uniref:dockerin type I domain-containing protein n=1 Tax=Ruminococcus callidus TaxID=40519 RepID=UPI0026771F18|nr:dockerin type I domain-containing protein [uncultured Ruminococcus sp.]